MQDLHVLVLKGVRYCDSGLLKAREHAIDDVMELEADLMEERKALSLPPSAAGMVVATMEKELLEGSGSSNGNGGEGDKALSEMDALDGEHDKRCEEEEDGNRRDHNGDDERHRTEVGNKHAVVALMPFW